MTIDSLDEARGDIQRFLAPLVYEPYDTGKSLQQRSILDSKLTLRRHQTKPDPRTAQLPEKLSNEVDHGCSRAVATMSSRNVRTCNNRQEDNQRSDIQAYLFKKSPSAFR
jgi:hypothetical protein